MIVLNGHWISYQLFIWLSMQCVIGKRYIEEHFVTCWEQWSSLILVHWGVSGGKKN